MHGPATDTVLANAAYRAETGADNPNPALVRRLRENGVEVHVRLAALTTLATCQLRGFALIAAIVGGLLLGGSACTMSTDGTCHIDRSTGGPFLGDPAGVITAGGLRIGLLALGYHDTQWTGDPKNTQSLDFGNGIDAARRYVPDLRRRADLVVVVSHQGTKVDELRAPHRDRLEAVIGTAADRIGRQWTADLTRAVGERVLDVRVGATSLEAHRSYRKVVDVVEAAFQSTSPVTAPATGSIRIVSAER